MDIVDFLWQEARAILQCFKESLAPKFPNFCFKAPDRSRAASFGYNLTINLYRNLEKKGVIMKGVDSYASKQESAHGSREGAAHVPSRTEISGPQNVKD